MIFVLLIGDINLFFMLANSSSGILITMNRYKKMKTNDNKWKLKPKYEKRYISRNSFENGIDSILKRVRVMVFNATVNNISVISWRSVLLVEKTGVPGENHRPVTSQKMITPEYCKIQSNVFEHTSNIRKITTKESHPSYRGTVVIVW